MLMMERNEALRTEHSEEDETDDDGKSSSDFLLPARPLNEVQGLNLQRVSDMTRRLQGVSWFGQQASSSPTIPNPLDIANTMSEAISTLDTMSPTDGERRGGSSSGSSSSTRTLPMSDLYRRSSPQDVSVMNTNVITNTSPMQFSIDRVVPSSSGMLRLDQNYMLFPSSTCRVMSGKQQVPNKPIRTKKENELDMNLPFPVKLHYILSNPKYQNYISWLPHGRSWRIVKPEAFEQDLIPKFFRSSKIASFMRQVNGWAFTRVVEGQDLNAYYHELFLRGIPELSLKMKRPPKVKNAASAARNASGAGTGNPDFYNIAKIAPLPPSAPFRPVIKESKSGFDAGSSAVTPRYMIQPINVEEQEAGEEETAMDVLPLDAGSWPPGDGEDQARISSSDFEFDDNFLIDSEGDQDDTVRRRGADPANTRGREEQTPHDDDFATAATTATTTTTSTALQLSQADVSYLAHQNRILKFHLEGKRPGPPAEQDHARTSGVSTSTTVPTTRVPTTKNNKEHP